jgi:hypothetical protein
MKHRSRTKAHDDLHLAFGSSQAGTTPGRCLREFRHVELPLTSKRRRMCPTRRLAHATFFNIGEE